jgi:hypothetical protein
MEAMMKSDLEIENTASPPLRRSLADHNPVWSITGAFRVVHFNVPKGDGPDAEGVLPEP